MQHINLEKRSHRSKIREHFHDQWDIIKAVEYARGHTDLAMARLKMMPEEFIEALKSIAGQESKKYKFRNDPRARLKALKILAKIGGLDDKGDEQPI